jgi:ammonium transporter, Amt family
MASLGVPALLASHLTTTISSLAATAPVDPAAVGWVLAASALVLLMTPGVAFFYGGMVRAQHVLNMLMQNLAVMAVVSVLWVLIGFSLAFGGGDGLVGDLRFAGLGSMDEQVPGFTGPSALVIPTMLFAAFQMMFAIVTPALITGATADRWRFSAFLAFVPLWMLLVYAPIAHWLFSPVGWASSWGALDFAGGMVVHTNAGAAGLALAIVLGRRRGWPRVPMRPHNLPFVVLGAALMWFGWFGFNAGSALRADSVAVSAFVNTNTAASAALLAWSTVEVIRFRKPTTLGAASGVVAGLVAITPCAGFVTPVSALIIGLLAGFGCAGAVSLKMWFSVDDSLDVVGVHLVGGAIGTLALGLFASSAVNARATNGLFNGGGYDLLGRQTVALVAVALYSFTATYAIGKVLDRVIGNRVPAAQEQQGLDVALHGESGYELGAGLDRQGARSDVRL